MTEGRFLYFVSGLGFGVAATLLWAPKSGAATRAAIGCAASDGQDFVRQQAAGIRETIEDAIQRGKKAAKTTTDGLIEAFGDGKSVLLR